MKLRILNFLNNEHFLNVKQNGFRKRWNTEQALKDVISGIYTATNDKNKCSAIILAFTMASRPC